MSDEELINALRSINHMNVDACFLQSHFYSKAADRIEQLATERDTWQKEAMRQNAILHNVMMDAAKAEAKLAKAVEALRLVVTAKGLTDPIEYGYDTIVYARAVLAELEKSE